jgi:hypothetical protein
MGEALNCSHTRDGADRFSAGYPPLSDRLSAAFSLGFPREIRRESRRFPHDLHTIYARIPNRFFAQFFSMISEGNSGPGREEKWRKASGAGWSAEKRSSDTTPRVFRM